MLSHVAPTSVDPKGSATLSIQHFTDYEVVAQPVNPSDGGADGGVADLKPVDGPTDGIVYDGGIYDGATDLAQTGG
jgi:hypothetical protein